MAAAILRSALRRSGSSSTASSYFVSRGFATAPSHERKLAVLGASGGIGHPLSRLAFYDIAGTPCVAADVNHINTRSEVKLGKNRVEDVLGFGPLSDYEQQGLKALKSELKSSIEKGVMWHAKSKNPTILSVYEPVKPIFRPLSPHLPIYKPQTSSTVSITNRISAMILTAVPLSYAFLTLKLGPICLANESVYQALHYSSKLGPISLQITALAMTYHLVHGLHDLYVLYRP